MSHVCTLYEYEGRFHVSGVCLCGLGATMSWATKGTDGSFEPRCGKCRRADARYDRSNNSNPAYHEIDREIFEYLCVQEVMES
jgi:hypothetical protein